MEKCSEYVKRAGVESLALFSEQSGVQVRTLQNWYESRRKTFDKLLIGCIAEGYGHCDKCGNLGEVMPSIYVRDGQGGCESICKDCSAKIYTFKNSDILFMNNNYKVDEIKFDSGTE